jgi:hypothetical protein
MTSTTSCATYGCCRLLVHRQMQKGRSKRPIPKKTNKRMNVARSTILPLFSGVVGAVPLAVALTASVVFPDCPDRMDSSLIASALVGASAVAISFFCIVWAFSEYESTAAAASQWNIFILRPQAHQLGKRASCMTALEQWYEYTFCMAASHGSATFARITKANASMTSGCACSHWPLTCCSRSRCMNPTPPFASVDTCPIPRINSCRSSPCTGSVPVARRVSTNDAKRSRLEDSAQDGRNVSLLIFANIPGVLRASVDAGAAMTSTRQSPQSVPSRARRAFGETIFIHLHKSSLCCHWLYCARDGLTLVMVSVLRRKDTASGGCDQGPHMSGTRHATY